MKQYAIGIITGALILMSAMVFIGATNNESRFEIIDAEFTSFLNATSLPIKTVFKVDKISGKTWFFMSRVDSRSDERVVKWVEIDK